MAEELNSNIIEEKAENDNKEIPQEDDKRSTEKQEVPNETPVENKPVEEPVKTEEKIWENSGILPLIGGTTDVDWKEVDIMEKNNTLEAWQKWQDGFMSESEYINLVKEKEAELEKGGVTPSPKIVDVEKSKDVLETPAKSNIKDKLPKLVEVKKEENIDYKSKYEELEKKIKTLEDKFKAEPIQSTFVPTARPILNNPINNNVNKNILKVDLTTLKPKFGK